MVRCPDANYALQMEDLIQKTKIYDILYYDEIKINTTYPITDP